MPFSQTLAVLVNSILLILIALDRYMAIKRVNKGPWKPTKVFCVTCCLLIWGFAAAAASPLLRMYNYNKVYVVPDYNNNDSSSYYTGFMCGRSEVCFEI